jgi:hypothetical protein
LNVLFQVLRQQHRQAASGLHPLMGFLIWSEHPDVNDGGDKAIASPRHVRCAAGPSAFCEVDASSSESAGHFRTVKSDRAPCMSFFAPAAL